MEPPRLAAKYWEEHSGKQMLSTFLGKGSGSKDAGLVPLLLASSLSKEEPLTSSDVSLVHCSVELVGRTWTDAIQTFWQVGAPFPQALLGISTGNDISRNGASGSYPTTFSSARLSLTRHTARRSSSTLRKSALPNGPKESRSISLSSRSGASI